MHKNAIHVLLSIFVTIGCAASAISSTKDDVSDGLENVTRSAEYKTPGGNHFMVFNPGKLRQGITMYDNIVYASVKAPLKGKTVDLKMSIVTKLGNSELKNATGKSDPDFVMARKPAIVYLNGGGWRGADKNQMVPEMLHLVEAGYVVAFVYYRSSAEAVFPAQIIDVKSAIRYLRANADKYGINPGKIGITGRSAGGSLTALASMNLPGYDEGDNLKFSSDVQFGLDMFGPVNMKSMALLERSRFSPTSRWKKDSETHLGAYMGDSYEKIPGKYHEASAVFQINAKTVPMLILHGDADPLVPFSQSVELYDAMKAAGKEVDFFLIKGAGHGSDEFWQESTRKLSLQYFDKYLKN